MNLSPYYDEAKKFADYSMDRLKGFSVLDFAILKACLVSLGILIGARFSKFFKKLEFVMLLAFVFSYIFLIFRIFTKVND